MTRSRRVLKAAVSGPLAALLLVLSVAVPVLERADLTHGTVVESEHDPGSCPTPHDHTVCTQVSANQSATGATPSDPFGWLDADLERGWGAEDVVPTARSFEAPARAPPFDLT